jgi:hypothetical protein
MFVYYIVLVMPPKKPCPPGSVRNPKTQRCKKMSRPLPHVKETKVVVEKVLEILGKQEGVEVAKITPAQETTIAEQALTNPQIRYLSLKKIGFWVITTVAGVTILYTLRNPEAVQWLASSWSTVQGRFRGLYNAWRGQKQVLPKVSVKEQLALYQAQSLPSHKNNISKLFLNRQLKHIVAQGPSNKQVAILPKVSVRKPSLRKVPTYISNGPKFPTNYVYKATNAHVPIRQQRPQVNVWEKPKMQMNFVHGLQPWVNPKGSGQGIKGMILPGEMLSKAGSAIPKLQPWVNPKGSGQGVKGMMLPGEMIPKLQVNFGHAAPLRGLQPWVNPKGSGQGIKGMMLPGEMLGKAGSAIPKLQPWVNPGGLEQGIKGMWLPRRAPLDGAWRRKKGEIIWKKEWNAYPYQTMTHSDLSKLPEKLKAVRKDMESALQTLMTKWDFLARGGTDLRLYHAVMDPAWRFNNAN